MKYLSRRFVCDRCDSNTATYTLYDEGIAIAWLCEQCAIAESINCGIPVVPDACAKCTVTLNEEDTAIKCISCVHYTK